MVLGSTHDVNADKQQQQGQDADSATHEHQSLKDRLRHPFPELREKLKDSRLYDVKVGAIHLKHRLGKFENLINTNHRHDEEHEQITDAKRTKIAEAHRFQSFAPERDGNILKWYVDGRDYFHAVSVALERARETIYIADWWLSPELFLRRPPYYQQKWRLDYTLKRAAERGVKIFIVLYKEVKQALTCNSEHSKHALEALCPKGSPGYGNIVVMRHPDHNVFENASDMTFYWAHHEKFIVIDYDLAFIGGLDLCFGRWDIKQHPLADAHPPGVRNEIFPGQDFNNNRIMDFQTVEDWQSNELSKIDYGRMPWHDVSMGLIGPSVYDIAEHFILRWNFCKRDKYKRDDQYDWLLLAGRTGDHEDLIGVQRPKHPVGEYISHPLSPIETKTGNPNQGRLVRKEEGKEQETHADHDVETDHLSEHFHDAQESLDEHGYTSEQHRRGHGAEKWIHEHEIHRPHLHTDKSLPALPDEAKYATAEAPPGRKTALPDVKIPENMEVGDGTKQEHPHVTGNNPKEEGFVTASGGVTEKSKGYHSELVGALEMKGGQGPVHSQIVRSSADWSSGILTEQSIQNAYCEVIRGAKHLVYIENQFFITATGDKQAPIHNLIGAAIVDACVNAHKEGRKFRVILVIPSVPGFAGDLRSDAAAGTRAIMDYQYKSICRGEESIFGRIKAEGIDPTQYVFVFNLRSYDRINKTPELKAKEEGSDVKYHDMQRAHAQEIMGEEAEGASKSKKGKKKEGQGVAHRGQATDFRGLVKQNAEKEMYDGSSESESDEEKRTKHTGTNKNGKSNVDEKKQRFDDGGGGAGSPDEGQDENVLSMDTIAKDAMLNEPKVSEENYAGREPGTGTSDDNKEKMEEMREQEKENFIQEELYIHAKLLVVDDRIAICGSSNINDRSQLGFHDSELAIVMEDTIPLSSKMDGKDYVAGRHAASLRRILWREHLGLIPPQPLDATDDPNAQPPGDGDNDFLADDEWDQLVADPLNDKLWDMWTSQATTNTQVFRHLFHADPDDNIKTFEEYDRFLPKESHKAGHLFDPYQPVDNVRNELDKVRGHLVWMPLRFLEGAEMAEKGMQVNAWTESIYT